MHRQGGFTLIELLIVIAIIGILAAVLIPSLLSARNKSHNVAAAGCAREFMIQGGIYWVDHNGYKGFTGEAPYNSRTCAKGVKDYHLDTVEDDLLEGRIISLSGTTFHFSTQTGVTQVR